MVALSRSKPWHTLKTFKHFTHYFCGLRAAVQRLAVLQPRALFVGDREFGAALQADSGVLSVLAQ